MNSIRYVPMREIVDFAIGGGWGKDEPDTIHTEHVAVIRGTDFVRARSMQFDEIPKRFESRKRLTRRVVKPGDILLEISGGSAAKGQSTGRSLLITEALVSGSNIPVIPASFCRLVRIKDAIALPRYVYYCLQEMYLSGRAGEYEHQSTGISNFQFEHFLDAEEVPLPSLPEQQAIADILGALDDKIELNRKMNATLDELARTIFRSWFVDVDPVRARAEGREPFGMDAGTAALFPDRFVDSELGPIPEGWEATTFGMLAANVRHNVPADAIDDSMQYIGLEHMPSRSIALTEWETAKHVTSNKSAFIENDILFGKLRPYFHKVGLAPRDGVCSTDILVIRPKEPHYLAMSLAIASSDQMIQHTDARSSGTRMPRAHWRDLAEFPIARPSEAIIRIFDERVRPMLELVVRNIHESRTLAELRDTLLPELISGRIRVPEAEKAVAGAV